MTRPETIIVHFVHDYIHSEYEGKNKGKHVISFAGVSDKPTKLMRLQVWEMPFNTRTEARETLDGYLKQASKGNFIIVLMPKMK